MIQKTLRTYSPKSRRRKFVIDENLYTYLFIQHRDRLSTKESRLNLSPFESLIKSNSPGFLFSSATHSLESIERRFPDESFSPPTGRVLAEKMGELPKSSTYSLTFILIHSLSLLLLSLSLSLFCANVSSIHHQAGYSFRGNRLSPTFYSCPRRIREQVSDRRISFRSGKT